MNDDTNDPCRSDAPHEAGRTTSGSATVRHHWTQSDEPSVVIVEAVAAATGRSTADLPPLQGTIDVDALDTLLDGGSSAISISFQYADTTVSVDGSGSIVVHVDGGRTAEGDR